MSRLVPQSYAAKPKALFPTVLLLALIGANAAMAAEVAVNAGDYEKLNGEQKAAILESLKSSKLVGPSDSLAPTPDFVPVKPDQSKAAATPQAAACVAKCEADVAEAKKVCTIAMFFGFKDQCNLIVDGVGIVSCMTSC